MRRVLRLSERFYRSRRVLVAPRTLPSQALAATLGRLIYAELPTPVDFLVLFPLGGVAWARQVLGLRLWVLFRFDDREVTVLAVTDREPVPVDE